MKTKSSSLMAIICLSLFIYAGPLLPQTFALDDVLSAPYPTGLVAAEKTDRIAWVANDRGVRNIWTAAAPDFQAHKLTDYTEDDGQVLGSLQLTPDGSILVYVRGGNTNRAGEHANPTSNPKGVEQTIWAVRTAGAQPWKLASGQSPILSPDGAEVIFSRKGQFFEIRTAQKKNGPEETPKPQPLFKTRGRNANPRWSPDGSRIAFVSRRGDHSFIGVYAIENKAIHWISPGVDRDTNPVWSPDGKQLAYLRTPGLKKHELRNLTGGNPFAIWVANVQTGKAQQIWQSPADDGGFAQYYPAAPLRWTADNRLLFYSEHENWMHIYSLAADGGALTDLTPGNSEAEHSALSPDNKFLFFSSNQGDIDRRDIWKVSTENGTPSQVTHGEDIETEPVPLASGQTIAFRGAGPTRPTAIRIVNSDGSHSKIIFPENLPKGFPQKLLVTPRQAIFKAADGWEIHEQLFLPRNAKAGDKRPALIFMHGGPIRQMLLGWH
ncbi:MAG: DPP IV N-terminal domain-containing protein, partial [bacterium]